MSDNSWIQFSLRELIDITHGFAFKGVYFTEEETQNVLLTPGNFAIGGGFKDDKLKYYFGEVPEDYVLAPRDLIVTMTDLSKNMDTLGYPALIPDNPRKRFLHNQRLGKVLIQNENQLDKYYLYYLLRTDDYRQEVKASASGTVIKHTSPERIRNFHFLLPQLSEQRAIAKVLRSLDDKIELNRHMNQTIESLTRAIFRSWFMEFDPVRVKMEGRQPVGMDAETAALFPDDFEVSTVGDIPRGWKVESLKQHIKTVRGLSYKGAFLTDGGMPMHNLNSIHEGGGYKYEGIKYYNGEYKPRHLLKAGDVIVANTEQGFDELLIGYPAIVPEYFEKQGLFSHHLYKVTLLKSSGLTSRFFYFMLSHQKMHGLVAGFSNGTTVNMLPSDGLEMPLFVVPPQAVVMKFDQIVKPLLDKQEANIEEIDTLTALRDVLLPRLMSGEVRV